MDRFWNRADTSHRHGGCWKWCGALGNQFYGQTTLGGRSRSAHRVAFELYYGGLPLPGFDVIHLCEQNQCVNPEHLRGGSNADNSRMGVRVWHAKNQKPGYTSIEMPCYGIDEPYDWHLQKRVGFIGESKGNRYHVFHNGKPICDTRFGVEEAPSYGVVLRVSVCPFCVYQLHKTDIHAYYLTRSNAFLA